MTDFPCAILDYWHEAFGGRRVDTEGHFALTVVPTLNRRCPAMILEQQDGATRAAITPELAEAIGIDAAGDDDGCGFARTIDRGGRRSP